MSEAYPISTEEHGASEPREFLLRKRRRSRNRSELRRREPHTVRKENRRFFLPAQRGCTVARQSRHELRPLAHKFPTRRRFATRPTRPLLSQMCSHQEVRAKKWEQHRRKERRTGAPSFHRARSEGSASSSGHWCCCCREAEFSMQARARTLRVPFFACRSFSRVSLGKEREDYQSVNPA